MFWEDVEFSLGRSENVFNPQGILKYLFNLLDRKQQKGRSRCSTNNSAYATALTSACVD